MVDALAFHLADGVGSALKQPVGVYDSFHLSCQSFCCEQSLEVESSSF